MEKICKKCGKLKEHHAHGLCNGCYQKEEYVTIPSFGNIKKGRQKTLMWANGVTKEIKPLIKKIRERVLNDCIKNPSKYLNTQDTEQTKGDENAK